MVNVTFEDGKHRKVPYGTRIDELPEHPDFEDGKFPVIAAKVNNEITSLTYKLEVNSDIKAIRIDSRAGARIYRSTLCFILAIAARRVYPGRRLVIGHSLGKGYYYHFDDHKPVEARGASRLKKEMESLVSEDLSIIRGYLSYVEAVEYFKKHNQDLTSMLLEYRNDNKVPTYSCGMFTDLAHSPLAPRTGICKIFDIVSYGPGIILKYPPVDDPYTIIETEDNDVLFNIYQEYKNWGSILQVSCVGMLNEISRKGHIKEFITLSELLHDKKISIIADEIAGSREKVRVILIAGPSSSGKTTFSKKLALHLKILGFNPVAIGLDDYFLPRELTPRDADGKYDFETIKAIDIKLLNEHLLELFEGTEVETPVFDFKLGKRRKPGKLLRLPEDGILIMEGIHGLNPELTHRIPEEAKFSIYISALTQLNLDDHNRISTTDNRLIRRMVRDFQFRGHTPEGTLQMWASVRRGEEAYIFPYQKNADTAINSASDYELAVLRVYAEPLLRMIKPCQSEYAEAKRLLSFLEYFSPIPSKLVPQSAIVREFIGDSAFKY